MNTWRKILQRIAIIFIVTLTVQTSVKATVSTESTAPGQIVMGGQQYYCGNHGADLTGGKNYELEYARKRNLAWWRSLCICNVE